MTSTGEWWCSAGHDPAGVLRGRQAADVFVRRNLREFLRIEPEHASGFQFEFSGASFEAAEVDELQPFIDDKDRLSELADGLRAWVLGCVCSAGLHVSSQLNAVRSLATDAGSLPISPKKPFRLKWLCRISSASHRAERAWHSSAVEACVHSVPSASGSCSQAEPVAHALMRRVV